MDQLEPITKWCPDCAADLPISEFYLSASQLDGLSIHCGFHNRQRSNASRRKRRLLFIAAMGGCCERCGFSDWRALQVDHVNSGGAQERRKMKSDSKKFQQHVLAHRDDYQLLCANCNWIKRYEEDEAKGAISVVRQVPTERFGHRRRFGRPVRGHPVGMPHSDVTRERIRESKLGTRLVVGDDGLRHYTKIS